MRNLKVLAVGSFAVHGTASLKAMIKILGSRVLPVPSVVLSGLTNMKSVTKLDVPFEKLLTEVFELAVFRGQRLILYIGYLGKPEQADVLAELIRVYRPHIAYIVTDPVCGDHGRMYVPAEIAERWPALIRLSDIVFPNLSEIKILTGNDPAAAGAPEAYIEQFRGRYPEAELVVTSMLPTPEEIGVELYGENRFSFYHPYLSRNFGGSGDAFLALFLLHFFFEGKTKEEALTEAARQTSAYIARSMEQEADELIIED
ncbi:bifunctional hydroxymethylpyrimidine kinase/phosphomethylpyrimidine kinase [Chitinophaga sp. 22620]|uniref:bifunctional hydroxymethylpyrimidine kinase/phosphomethylpyrimidine kinase n=1 Tax=Chitinophaga sp. 22620 TaxID=3453952 RepID=UPI003F8381ED